jgi:putative nucleotidyltransferase with HDIG domain
MAAAARTQLAEELLRRLAASLRSGQLYSRGHPLISRNLEGLGRAVETLHDVAPSIVIGLVGDEVIVDDLPIGSGGTLAPLVRRLRQIGIERIAIDRGVQPAEIAALAEFVASSAPDESSAATFPALPHIRVGRVTVGERVDGGTADMAAFRRLYADAVQSAESLWQSAQTEQRPDAPMAKNMVDGLAHAVSQNRTALMALTALREYDNPPFTHRVNVSILTMAQARSLGVDGPLLREFGLAALMHDIGKVKTPIEVLTKPEALTPDEFTIMKRHTVDGAEILRATPDVPALAPVVAFEHHLRLDGSGYPETVHRTSLNLGTMLCSIADVYDAMRSQRLYQQSFPTDRILEVMRRNDGRQFDQHLVRRFAQLVGVYPVGNLVKLNTNEIAVVLNAHAPDPYRPHVRIVLDRHGARVTQPIDLHLWEATGEGDLAPAIVGPVDPADVGIDPLTLL